MIRCYSVKKQGSKVRIQVAINEKLALKGRELGLNFSKILENALLSYIERLDGLNAQTMANGGHVDSRSESPTEVVLRPGFEPGSPARKAGILNRAILPELERIALST